MNTGTSESPCRDRKTGLIVFGILQLLMGGGCLLFLLLLGLSALLPRPPEAEMGTRALLPALGVYLLLSVWFVTMGIGSIRARRWARALILIAAWVWLVSGVMGMGFLGVFWDSMARSMAANGQVPAGVVSAILAVMVVVMAVIYLVIPGALVLFYGRRDVKETCERLDPAPRWTDRCPLPVLAMSLLMGTGAVCLPLGGCYHWPMPFFGAVLTGVQGAAVSLALLLAMAWLAWLAWRLDVRAWWGSLALVVAWSASAMLTFSRLGLMQFYTRMEIPAAQLAQMRPIAEAMDPAMIPLSAVWALALLGYLLYVRRFFPRTAGA
jgi:hypothetical protein